MDGGNGVETRNVVMSPTSAADRATQLHQYVTIRGCHDWGFS
jgi:hypothetical protein